MTNEWRRFYFPENVPLFGFRNSSPTNNWVTYTIFIYFNFSAIIVHDWVCIGEASHLRTNSDQISFIPHNKWNNSQPNTCHFVIITLGLFTLWIIHDSTRDALDQRIMLEKSVKKLEPTKQPNWVQP